MSTVNSLKKSVDTLKKKADGKICRKPIMTLEDF